MKEEGKVTQYNGFDGEITNEQGIYSFLRNDVHREDRNVIEKGTEVSFEPIVQKTNTGTFKMAKNISVIKKSKDIPEIPSAKEPRRKIINGRRRPM